MFKKNIFPYLFYFLILATFISGIELKEIILKTNNNFNNSIYSIKNAALNYINNIPSYYSIKNSKHEINENTDMYVSFDNPNKLEETGNYSVAYNKFIKSANISVFGNSGYFSTLDQRIELTATKNSFFQPGENLGSFSINFWVYPSSYSNDETILKIGSEYFDNKTGKVISQSINAKIINSKITWEFNNVFSTLDKTKDSFVLESYSRIMPEKWSYINLTYDSLTGIIRENINDKEDGILIATEDKSLKSTVYNLRFNSINKCSIILAPAFYGAIDEIYIIKNSDKSNFNKYNSPEAEITSKLIDFGSGGIILRNIILDDSKNNNAGIIYYYRYSNKPFDENEEFSKEVKWNALGKDKFDVNTIRFFQWKAVLLAGDELNFSPKFRGLTIKYEENIPPAKPSGLKIIAQDNKVYLKWSMNTEKDIKGYKIYYGTKPGRYFGNDAKEGPSPIDIGLINNYTISGLNENLIYYFSITAYDDNEHSHESEFSEESSIRVLTRQ